AAVKATCPTSIGEIETEKTDIMSDSWLAGQGVDAIFSFEVGIFFTKSFQSCLGHLICTRHIFAQAEHEERGLWALYRHGPTRIGVFAFQTPILGVLEANTCVLKLCNHSKNALSRRRRSLYFTFPLFPGNSTSCKHGSARSSSRQTWKPYCE